MLALSGCGSLDYYAQSMHGQLGVMAASRPVEDVLADPRTIESVRRVLQSLPSLRQFAVGELALPETDSYRLYADLQREAMVWNVVAAPVDSLNPRKWCYPVLGCAAYRGYFDKGAAVGFAAGLAADGWDTAVEPVPAYSTLGWFSDPLPSTVVQWPLPEIAGLIFHELAHEALYVPGESAFNEAYATVVEKEGVRRWLERFGTQEQRDQHQRRQQRRGDFLKLLEQTRVRLSELYVSDIEANELVLRKAGIFDRLRDEYRLLKRSWGGYSGYDNWMQRPLNNAYLASIRTYHALEPAFRQILRQSHGDMTAFHKACVGMASKAAAQREEAMSRLLALAEGG